MAFYRCPTVLIIAMTVVILMVQINQSSAKRGCSAFGHSCFGGHGKRADEDVLLLPGSDSDQQSRLVFPPSPESGPEEGDDVMLQNTGSRTGGYGVRSASSSSTSAGVSSLIPPPHSAQFNLSPFLRQWLQSYRRSTGDIEVK